MPVCCSGTYLYSPSEAIAKDVAIVWEFGEGSDRFRDVLMELPKSTENTRTQTCGAGRDEMSDRAAFRQRWFKAGASIIVVAPWTITVDHSPIRAPTQQNVFTLGGCLTKESG